MVRRTCPPNVPHLALLGNNFSCILVRYGSWILLKSGTGMSAYLVAAGFTSIKECIPSTGKRHGLSSCRPEARAESPKMPSQRIKINLERSKEHPRAQWTPRSMCFLCMWSPACKGTSRDSPVGHAQWGTVWLNVNGLMHHLFYIFTFALYLDSKTGLQTDIPLLK